MARRGRARLTLADLSPELAAEARRQLAGGGVDLLNAPELRASHETAVLEQALEARDGITDRDLKPGNVIADGIADRDVKPHNALLKRPPRGMSKTERAYQDHLQILKAAGEVVAYAYEPLRLILAPRMTYLPDFAVLRAANARVQFVEVKPRRSDDTAFWHESSRIKVKTAAQIHGVLFEFVAVWPTSRGGWKEERFDRR